MEGQGEFLAVVFGGSKVVDAICRVAAGGLSRFSDIRFIKARGDIQKPEGQDLAWKVGGGALVLFR